MNQAHSSSHGSGAVHKPHVLPRRIYFAVWIGLLVLTVATVYVSYFDFGTFNVIVAMAVATAKASLVVLFFMHLKYDQRFNVLAFLSSVVFLGLFFIFTLADTTRRGMVDPIERGTIEVLPKLPGHAPVGMGDGHGAAPDSTGARGAAPDTAGSTGTTPVGGTGAADPAPAGGGH